VGTDTDALLVVLRDKFSLCFSYLATVTTCFKESSALSINGKNALAIKYGPLTLTSQTLHQVSGSLSLIVVMSMRPALLTKMSSLPADVSTSAAA
jgi:hypothetical protein